MSKNKLVLEMGIFAILVFGIFSYIVIYDKRDIILQPKVEEKLNQYIQKKYQNIQDNLNIGKIEYNKKEDTYTILLTDKDNKHLSFRVIYHNKKITDSYKKDYENGESLYTYLKTNYEKELMKETEKDTTITFFQKLDQYTTNSRKKIIISKDPRSLPIYNISISLNIKKFTIDNISKNIKGYYQLIKKLGYSPKEYEFLLINNQSKNINTSIKISKLTEELIENNLNEIIGGIIDNDISLQERYSITYEYIY